MIKKINEAQPLKCENHRGKRTLGEAGIFAIVQFQLC